MRSEVADVTGIVKNIGKSVFRHQDVGGGGGGGGPHPPPPPPAPPLDQPLHFMILEVLRMTNINFHLTISILNQKIRL